MTQRRDSAANGQREIGYSEQTNFTNAESAASRFFVVQMGLFRRAGPRTATYDRNALHRNGERDLS